jgi:hypothetical protein
MNQYAQQALFHKEKLENSPSRIVPRCRAPKAVRAITWRHQHVAIDTIASRHRKNASQYRQVSAAAKGRDMLEVLRKIATLAAISLAVGLVLAAVGFHPSDLPGAFDAVFGDAARMVARVVGWAWPYIVLGATVVVPAWLLLYLWRRLRR